MRTLSISAASLGAIALATFTIPSSAGASGCEAEFPSVAAHIFDMSDTNEDDSLSRAEFADAGLERYGITFDEFDANDDGETSVDEYFELFELHHPPNPPNPPQKTI